MGGLVFFLLGIGFSQLSQGELPECFRNEAYVKKLVSGLKSLKKEGARRRTPRRRGPLKRRIPMMRRRLASSEKFGPMMSL